MSHTAMEQLGRCNISSERLSWSMDVDALAVDQTIPDYSHVMILSAVGPGTTTKAVTAIIKGKEPHYLNVDLPGCGRESHMLSGPYNVYRHRLGFDSWHLLAIAADETLVPNFSQRSLWNQFSGPRYNTPMLREWTAPVAQSLLAKKLLRKLVCFRCDAAVLSAWNHHLDAAVIEGIKSGTLKFE